MSRVALLEQINVLQHQVFVVLNSHKRSLFLCDLVNCTYVQFLFQYAVGLARLLPKAIFKEPFKLLTSKVRSPSHSFRSPG